jgi:hypothetical protein
MVLTHDPARDPCALLALPPALELARRLFKQRQLHLVTAALADDPEQAALRVLIAAEHTVGLILPLTEPLTSPLTVDQSVSLTDRLALTLGALTGLLDAATPLDVPRPLVSNQAQRACVLPFAQATVALHVTVALVLAALTDDALQIVVLLPSADVDGVVLEVESDTAGIASDHQQHAAARVVAALQTADGTLSIEPRPHSTCARITLPALTPNLLRRPS